MERIRELHAANYYAYGSRRMWKTLRRAGEDVGRGRVERLSAPTASRAPSAAASRGARRRPIRSLSAARISCNVTSPPARRIDSEWVV
jgi:HTH-like domain